MKLNKDANIAVYLERHDSDFGRLDRNRLNKSTGIKFRAFCLFVTTGYPFSLEGGILNVESVPSASGE